MNWATLLGLGAVGYMIYDYLQKNAAATSDTVSPSVQPSSSSNPAPTVTQPVSATSTASNIAPATTSANPFNQGGSVAPAATGVTASLEASDEAAATATSTPAVTLPIPTTTIQKLYPSSTTVQAEAGESAASVSQVQTALDSTVAAYSAQLSSLIGQPMEFLDTMQQLFQGNPGLMDGLSADVRTYYNQLVQGGPGGSISIFALGEYYDAIAQYGADTGPSMFAYWKANGMVSEPVINAPNVNIPAVVLE